MGFKRKDVPMVDINEFFSDTDFQVQGRPPQKKRTSVAAAVGLLGLAVVTGVLVATVPLYGVSATVQVVEEPLQTWKELPETLGEPYIAERSSMLDVNGNVFAEVWTEDRVKLSSLEEVSQYAIDGLIATEDKRFYDHAGIDLIGTARAALDGSGGGSGITQQLMKNLQFYNQAATGDKEAATEVSLDRKLRELKLAIGYEKTHTKDEILLEYFNTVSFGSPNIYSIESASRYFFGKSARDLTLAEASVLVGSVQNPSKHNLTSEEAKESWKARQKTVLNRMVVEDKITQEEADEAYAQEFSFVLQKPNGNCTSSAYPFYCDYVLDYLRNSTQLGDTPEERQAVLARGGLRIQTYMDPRLMDMADARVEADFGNDNRAVAPVAIVEPGTGGVQAIAVNRNYGTGENETTINLALNPTGTGSTYKLFALAAALKAGWTEADLAFASESCPFVKPGYDTPPGGMKNSTSCASQGGFLDYREATAISSNTWYVTLATRVGMDKVLDITRELDLNIPAGVTERSLSMVIGSVGNTPVNMAAAYATFSNEGVYCPATPVASFEYADGSKPPVPDSYDPKDTSCKRILSPKDAGTILKALRANTVPGDVPRQFGRVGFTPGYDAVGKTGTNESYNYAWAQVSANHSLFMDVYDPVNYISGVVDRTRFQGSTLYRNAALQGGSNIMRDILAGTENIPLNYDTQDESAPEVPVNERDFLTVPSVTGVAPAEALSTLQALGLNAQVSKETREAPPGFPSGVVVEQSAAPGSSLPVGTTTEVILYVSQ